MTKENQSWIAGNQGRNPHVVWMLQTVTNRPEATKCGHEFVMNASKTIRVLGVAR